MFKECSLRVAAFGALGVLILSPVTAGAQSTAPSARRQTTAAANKVQLEPKAIEVLKAVGDRLAAAHTLFFVAIETVDSLSRRSEVTLQRPDKLRVSLSGDGQPLESYCNGNTMVTYSAAEKAFTIAKAPPTINECLKDAYKAAALETPVVDLILADLQGDLIRGLKHASYAGHSATRRRDNRRRHVFGRQRVGADVGGRQKTSCRDGFRSCISTIPIACVTARCSPTGRLMRPFARMSSPH